MVVFLVVVFLVVVFLMVDLAAVFAAVLAPPLVAPARTRAGVLRSLVGQSMFTHFFHGPRAVSTMIMGAPHSGHVSSVAVSLPRAGSG